MKFDHFGNLFPAAVLQTAKSAPPQKTQKEKTIAVEYLFKLI
jgi:hypothetical protein